MADTTPSRLARRIDPLLAFLMRPKVRRARRWSFLVTVPLGVAIGRALGIKPDLGDGVVVALALVALDLAALAAIIVLGTRLLGAERREIVLDLFMHPAARRALMTEASMVATLARAAARRPPRAPAFSYHGGSAELGLAIALLPATAAEAAAVHLLLPERWVVAKVAVLALSAYGVLWMLALGLGPRVHPHTVADGVLRLRLGSLYAADVPLAAIAAARPVRERAQRGAGLELRADGSALLAARGRVDLRLTLREPVTVRRPFGEPVAVTEIAVAADRPAELAAAIEAGRAVAARAPARPARGGRWALPPTPAELLEAASS